MLKRRPLQYVSVTKSRHGKPVVYFRRGGHRVRLPDDTGSPEFRAAYAAALAGQPLPHVRYMPQSPIEARKQKVESALDRAVRGARARSVKRGLAFDLTTDWALAQAERAGFRCALTGIEFYAKHTSAGVKNPFAPSLDRINPKAGYTQSNVRLVIFAVNAMLLDWGHEIFEQVANSYRYQKNKKRTVYCQTLETNCHTFLERE